MYFTIVRASGGYRAHIYGGNGELVFWTEVYTANAAKYDALFTPISQQLTDDKLIELNAKVDVEGEAPADVAKDFLTEIGVVSG